MMSRPFIPKRRKLALTVAVSALCLAAGSVWWLAAKKPTNLEPELVVLLEWHQLLLEAERYTEGYRAPVAARTYAYAGLAAWQSALPAMSQHAVSLEKQMPGLQLPQPDIRAEYHLLSLINASYSVVFDKFFHTAPQHLVLKKKKLKERWEKVASVAPATLERSVAFAEKTALAIFEWSATDTMGHLAQLHNFDKGYSPPAGHGYWQPCVDFPTPALLPHWGQTRTFCTKTQDYLAQPLPAYSTDPNSLFYKEALEVYTVNSPLSEENLRTAQFWSDDHAGLTFSPAGRWVSITNQVIEREAPSIEKALETYLKVGLSLSDASVACWFSKYYYNLLRPETYIRAVFDPQWRAIVHTPPFPAYPSGHAMMGAAAAAVLEDLYGEDYSLTDCSHVGRQEFYGGPRSYGSFQEMALENAFSRVLLGVHFRVDCEEGLRLGFRLGKQVNDLQVRKEADFSQRVN